MKRQDTEDQVVESSGGSPGSADGTAESTVSPEGTDSPKEPSSQTDSSPTISSRTDEGRIGDGGNELGMGKVKEAVKSYMPGGSLIACDVAADFAITAGVSNWGGYGVACALYILNQCAIHHRYVQKGLGLSPTDEQRNLWSASLPSISKEEDMLHILVKYGVRSGKTANLGLEVDGLTFHPTHSDIIQRLRDLTLENVP